MSNVRFSKDGRVAFDPATHTYTLGEYTLTGVTSWVKCYKNPFNFYEKSRQESLKTKEPILSIQKRWKDKSTASILSGNAVHKVFEDFITAGKAQTSLEFPKTLIAAKFIQDIFKTKRLIPVAAEYIVYSEEQGLATMIDCICEHPAGYHVQLDWKSNESISKDNYGKFMLEPFNILPDCTYSHYSLQVAKAAQLCTDFNIKESFIVHIGEQDYEIIRPEKIIF